MNAPALRPSRIRRYLLAFAALAASLLAQAAIAQLRPNGVLVFQGRAGTTPAGTVISNSAYAEYEDAGGNAAQRVTSNVVTTTVSAVYGTFVNPPAAAKTGNSGEATSFAFDVINIGNATDAMQLAPSGTIPAGWTVSIIKDTDGDGVLDSGETQVATGTGQLQPGATAHFHYVVIVPVNTPDQTSNTLGVTATSAGDNTKTATGAYTLTVSAGVATVEKRIVETTSFKPGNIVTYEISTSNTGSVTIDNSTTIDHIPTGTTYVANSMRRGPKGSAYSSAIPLTDTATDGDRADYNVTNPGAISTGPGDLVPGEVSDSVFFRVRINNLPAGSVVSNVAVESYAGPNGQIEVESNAVTFTVGAVGDTMISPTEQSKFAEPGQEISYFMTVSNNGNASDYLNLALQSNTGFPWVFHTAEGNPQVPGTPLIDNNGDGIVDTGLMSAGTTRSIAVVGTVPSGMQDAAIDVTGVTVTTSIVANTRGVNQASLRTTIQGPRLTLAKTVAPTGAAPPGTVLTYTTTIRNTGTGNAYQVVIRDTVPQYTKYVANSMRASINGAPFAPLTDAAGDDGARFDTPTNSVVTVPATMGPNAVVILEFKVKID